MNQHEIFFRHHAFVTPTTATVVSSNIGTSEKYCCSIWHRRMPIENIVRSGARRSTTKSLAEQHLSQHRFYGVRYNFRIGVVCKRIFWGLVMKDPITTTTIMIDIFVSPKGFQDSTCKPIYRKMGKIYLCKLKSACRGDFCYLTVHCRTVSISNAPQVWNCHW